MFKSWRGRLYEVKPQNKSALPTLEGVSPKFVSIAANRGIPPTEKDMKNFFFPTIKDLMIDPSTMQDMDSAASLIADAIESNQGIGMIGDYDVDGATSVAIVNTFLSDLGFDKKMFCIPQRLIDGYGPNVGAVSHLHEGGASVLIVLDSGTTANEPIEHAVSLGMKVVVVDHHEPGPTWMSEKPPAFVVNPKRPDDNSGVETLCTAGLAILLCVRISAILRERGWEGLPNIMDYMGLAALGTVADIMPLKGLNRAYVCAGLSRMHVLPGLASLVYAAKDLALEEDFPKVTARDLGFLLGPAINAAGRIDDCMLGATALSDMDLNTAFEKSRYIVGINVQRKAMQEDIEKAAFEQAATIFEEGKTRSIVVYDEAWHPGIIGIVAGRLKEHYNLPAVVIGTKGKGSGRSAHDFDLGGAFIEAKRNGILSAGGGHKAAAGLTLAPGEYESFQRMMTEKTVGLQTLPDMIDGEVQLSEINDDFLRQMEIMEPFGAGNPTPTWLLKDVTLTGVKWVKNVHLRMTLQSGRNRMSAIMFNAKNGGFSDLEKKIGSCLNLLIQVSRNKRPTPGFSDIDIYVKDVLEDEQE